MHAVLHVSEVCAEDHPADAISSGDRILEINGSRPIGDRVGQVDGQPDHPGPWPPKKL